MHLLLPPSEAKRPGGRGRPLAQRTDDSPLAAARATALAALADLIAGPPTDAAHALALPPGVAADALASNAAVLDTATMPALARYTGVVYDGLAYTAMSPDQARVARRCCMIFSGLFGVLRGNEAVPDYRVPAKAVLPGIGVAATWWRPVLTDALGPMLRRGLVVDLRSSDYRAMWRPDREQAERVVEVRVLSPVARGGHAVVSFTSKLAKGRLAAALVERLAAGHPCTSPDDVLNAWRTCAGADLERSNHTGALPNDMRRLDLFTH